jgi:hypothetical protein
VIWFVALGVLSPGACSRTGDEDDHGQKDPLLPPATRSTFLEMIGKTKYPPAQAPGGSALLRWDFSGDRVHNYDYRLDAKSASVVLGHPTCQELEVDSELLVKSRGNGAASIFRRNRILSTTLNPPGGPKVPPVTTEAPDAAIHGVREDGRMVTGDIPTEVLVKLLFLLPPGPLKPGQSVSYPATVLVDVPGGSLRATGTAKTTLNGYVVIDGRTCARLDTRIDITDLKVPPKTKGTYRAATTGRTIAYFDVRERCLVLAEMAVMMSFRADMVETPLPGREGRRRSAKRPATVRAEMDLDNLVTLKLIQPTKDTGRTEEGNSP